MDVSALERLLGQVPNADADCAGFDAWLDEHWPLTHLLLSATPKVAGKRKQTATMTVVMEDGLVKTGLRDRSINGSIWVSGKTLRDCLEALERALGESPVPWRIQKEEFRRRS